MIMPRCVYGFIPADCADELRHDPIVRRRVRCIATRHVAALAGLPVLRLPARNGVRQALGELRSYRQVLENVMRRVPVLPARFGSRLPGRKTLVRLLGQHEVELGRAITAYGHLLQMDIQVTGPPDHPNICSRLVAVRAHIRLELEGLCLALLEEPAETGGALMNLTALIRALDEPRLDAALARLDGEFGGWLHFACTGPLPPCNFIRVICSRAASRGPGAGRWTLCVDSSTHGSALPLIVAAPAVAGSWAA